MEILTGFASGLRLVSNEPLIEWVDYRCRAEFIRPMVIITIGDQDVTLSAMQYTGA